MTSFQAALLGLVQGLTEFLPVSSSGHLVILQKAFGFSDPPIAFDVVVHTGTLLAVVLFFFKNIINIDRKLLKAILAALVPTAIIGLILQRIEIILFNSLTIIAWALITTTAVLISTLFVAKKKTKRKTEINVKTAFLIGIAQGLAIIPGISRSAATIVTGLWLGLDWKDSVTFAFLVSIPAIIAAQTLKLPDLINGSIITLPALTIGFTVAVISGLFSLRFLKFIVKTSKLHLFSIYTFLLALLLLS